jgi:hypothetical protein
VHRNCIPLNYIVIHDSLWCFYRLTATIFQSLHALLSMLTLLSLLPMVSGAPVNERPFPNIPFKEFSAFIEQNFSSSISLTSVLVILFSITEKVQLLSLHGCQQKGRYKGERSTIVTSWIRALAHQLRQRLEDDDDYLLNEDDLPASQDDEQITVSVALKLDQLAKLLNLYPYNNKGQFTGKLKPVSQKEIQPIHVICPDAVVCETIKCLPCSLPMSTKIRDIPLVTLIKGFTAFKNVQVLSGYCNSCNTTYYADHEHTPTHPKSDKYDKVYLNSARYIKIGQNLWVDQNLLLL